MTPEEKAAKQAFFALYIDQNVLMVSSDAKVTQIANTFFLERFTGSGVLKLTDLRSITAEHARQCFRIHSDWSGDLCKFGMDLHNRDTAGVLSGESIDNLRASGYAVRFRSYSVEDLVRMGWVKIKE